MRKWMGIFLLIACTSTASAAGRLEVNLASVKGKDNNISMQLTIGNSGDTALDLVEASLPEFSPEGRLSRNILKVSKLTGEEVNYYGLYVNTEGAPDEYMTIAPGKNKIFTMELAPNYDIRAGEIYTITLRYPISYLSQTKAKFKAADQKILRGAWLKKEAKSVDVIIPPSIDSQNLHNRAASKAATEDYKTCDAVTLDHMKNTVIPNSMEIAEATLNHYGGYFNTIVDGTAVDLTFAPDSRYTQWFGAHGDPDTPSADDTYNDNMIFATWYRFTNDSQNPKPPITVTCQCET